MQMRRLADDNKIPDLPSGTKTFEDVRSSIESIPRDDATYEYVTTRAHSTAKTWAQVEAELNGARHGQVTGQAPYGPVTGQAPCGPVTGQAPYKRAAPMWHAHQTHLQQAHTTGLIRAPQSVRQDLAFPISISVDAIAEAHSRSHTGRSYSRSPPGRAYSYSPSRDGAMSNPTDFQAMQASVQQTISQSQQAEATYLQHYHPRGGTVAVLPGSRHWVEGQAHPVLPPDASHAEARLLEEQLRHMDQQRQLHMGRLS